MPHRQHNYYPTILGAAHLVILYIFIQTIVDFPLAVWDYFHGTSLLYHPVKKYVMGIGSVAFILIYGYKRAHTRITELFPIRRFNPLLLIPMITFILGAQLFLGQINQTVNQWIPAPPWFMELFDKIFNNKLGWWGAFLKVVVVAPIIEESIFRGIIMHGLMRNYPKIVAIFISALFFALFHLNPWQFPATFLLGLLVGWIMVITRNLFACILGHAINNLLVLLSITYYQQLNEQAFFLQPIKDQAKTGYFLATFSVVILAVFAIQQSKKAKSQLASASEQPEAE